MAFDINILLALSPILLILILILFFRKSLAFASPVTYIFTVFISLLVWKIEINYLFASTLKGVLVAIDILLIIFGALFFLEFLKKTKLIDSIDHYISSISPDRRIQAILLIWFFGSFIEGTAGFGTPAAIVAPLLVGLGFPAITAVAIALIGNSTAVTFGAVGTPIRIGFANLVGMQGIDFKEIAIYIGTINLFAGIIVPVMILSVIVLTSKHYKNDKIKGIYEMVPYSVFAGLCFTIPYFLLTFLGQEFPSLVGALIGMAIIIPTTKLGFLVPKQTLEFRKKTIQGFNAIWTFSFIFNIRKNTSWFNEIEFFW
jgi:lactate permease